jgi:hypothetical protein
MTAGVKRRIRGTDNVHKPVKVTSSVLKSAPQHPVENMLILGFEDIRV